MNEPMLTRDEIASLRAIDKKLLRTILVPDQHIHRFLELKLMTRMRLEYFLTDVGKKIILEQSRKQGSH